MCFSATRDAAAFGRPIVWRAVTFLTARQAAVRTRRTPADRRGHTGHPRTSVDTTELL